MILLASSSPRRRELLETAGVPFQVVPSRAEEDNPQSTHPRDVALELARRKALGARELSCPEKGDVILGADTVVALEGRVLGKPSSREEAFAMLSALSGKVHTVYTGCCFLDAEGEYSFCAETQVEFYPLSPREIREYIATGDPMDKAGAYGIQGRAGTFVREIRGDYFTVVGLPAARVRRVWDFYRDTGSFPKTEP